MLAPKYVDSEIVGHLRVPARIGESPHTSLRRIHQPGFDKVEPSPCDAIIELRLPILVGLFQELVRHLVALRDFVEDFLRPRLPTEIAQHLENRREVADELRNTFNLLFE